MATQENPAPTRAQKFGEYAAAAARAAGYDIDSPRGGGKKALAERAGMSHASVSRMLSGQTIPDPAYLERLADALGVPLMELFVLSGIVSERASQTVRPSAEPDGALSLEAAARKFGIRSPDRVEMFKAMTKSLADQEGADEGVRAGKGA
ncbi:helix-turn-helix transcriptional regulator [Streptomyces stelliscabiei]|uniref:helix-turn-helix domain-containing protein n=1 Tax=Streptomyces stelliscabiei TaxID=146820 RepID=UPI002FF3A22C